MRIAIFGATSQIARDLIQSFWEQGKHECVLYARRPEAVTQWLTNVGVNRHHTVDSFTAFTEDRQFDAIINCVGVGNPAQAIEMGASIFDITLEYDELALTYVRRHPHCRYIFLSSGAVYGSNFDKPVNAHTVATVPVNNLHAQDWYGITKLHAECRHRSLPHLPIVDIRIFNYFSRTQDINASFLISDILRSIINKTVLRTSSEYMVRDYLTPPDFYRLVDAIFSHPATNAVIDCYSRAPIDKPALLAAMDENFGLHYEVVPTGVGVNATGKKPHYYSLNTRAADFGYRPALTSIEGIVQEMHPILACHMNRT